MHQQQQHPQQSAPPPTAFIRQMSPPMTIPLNDQHQRHFSPPRNPQEAYPGHISQQATNPFSPTAQTQSNIFQHFPSHSQQQQHQQMQNYQNIPVDSQQQMPVHPSQQHQQQYFQQQQQSQQQPSNPHNNSS